MLTAAAVVLAAGCDAAGNAGPNSPDPSSSRNGSAARAARASEVAESVRESTPTVSPEEQMMIATGRSSAEIESAKSWCAEPSHPGEMYFDPAFEPSDAQIHGINGWLIMCPSHPEAPQMQAAIQRGTEVAAQRANGQRFYAGTFRVGVEIQPGVYVIEKALEGCYWERLDDTGEIIDNNFIAGSTRAQVTIRASDYSFHSEHCGEWVKQ